MNWQSVFFATACISVSGCAAYELKPLSLNHPANAMAASAPPAPLSTTLAYSRADLPVALAAAESQGGHDSQHPGDSSSAEKTVVGEGKVIATVPNANAVLPN